MRRHPHEIHDADALRWRACVEAARRITAYLSREQVKREKDRQAAARADEDEGNV